jgi:hypothetical protein
MTKQNSGGELHLEHLQDQNWNFEFPPQPINFLHSSQRHHRTGTFHWWGISKAEEEATDGKIPRRGEENNTVCRKASDVYLLFHNRLPQLVVASASK